MSNRTDRKDHSSEGKENPWVGRTIVTFAIVVVVLAFAQFLEDKRNQPLSPEEYLTGEQIAQIQEAGFFCPTEFEAHLLDVQIDPKEEFSDALLGAYHFGICVKSSFEDEEELLLLFTDMSDEMTSYIESLSKEGMGIAQFQALFNQKMVELGNQFRERYSDYASDPIGRIRIFPLVPGFTSQSIPTPTPQVY